MELGLFEVASGLVVLGLMTVYYYLTWNFNFWSSRKVKGPKPEPLFGTTRNLVFGRMSMAQYTSKVYKDYSGEPLVGIFFNQQPVLMVCDPEIIKCILKTEFLWFSNRTPMKFACRAEPMTQNLFFLQTMLWDRLRQNLSSAFTPSQKMFYLLRECAEHLESFLEDYVEKNSVIECCDIAVKFTIDAIGSCIFGLKTNTITEEESKFQQIADRIFQQSFLNKIKIQLKLNAPWLLDWISSIFYDQELNEFFISAVAHTMDNRKNNNVKRNDFIDLLMSIKDDPSKLYNIVMTDSLLAAQPFSFLVEGFKTSSATISHTLYELAQNQSIQDKLREEIIDRFGKNNGDLTYEDFKDMEYLDKVVSETLRKYPPVSVIQRSSLLETYTFKGTRVNIPRDTKLWIPVHAIQHDPKIYPEPEKFDPERFDNERVKQRHSSFYLPFGDGPRNCIGDRFGKCQTKVGLIQILKNYKLEVCDQTCIPYVIDPKKYMLEPVGGIKLKFKKITS